MVYVWVQWVPVKRTNIYLRADQLKRLEEVSKKTGASVAELIRRAIDKVHKPKK